MKDIYQPKPNKIRITIKLPNNKPNETDVQNIALAQNLMSNQGSTRKTKIKLLIEKRFQSSENNQAYKFPRIPKSKFQGNSLNISSDSSLLSLKDCIFYDLREQNKSKYNKESRNQNAVKESFKNSNENNEKFIKGKYQNLKGKSFVNPKEKNQTLDGFNISSPIHQNKEIPRNKISNQSVDLKTSFAAKIPIKLNQLYQLTQNNLSFQRKKIFKKLNVFGNYSNKQYNNEMRSQNSLTNTFLEVNSLKITLPNTRSSNSFKITRNNYSHGKP